MASLFQEFRLKDVVLRNRIAVSPMCQYSSDNGFPNDWHFVHLGSRAVGGAGLVIVEATAVTPEGRISPADSGIYLDDHVEPFARISRFLKQHGAVPGIQLAHAGRKASASKPWEGNKHIESDKGGWDIIAPSAVPFGGNLTKVPREMIVARHRTNSGGVRRCGEASAGGRVRVAGTALRTRLPRPRVLLAARQLPHRQLRRQLREPHSVSCWRRSPPSARSGRSDSR